MNDTPFCGRRVKVWVILLVIFAIFVLAFSIWTAKNKGRIKMFGGSSNIEKQKALLSPATPQAASAPNTPLSSPAAQAATLPPNTPPSTLVTQPVALTNPYFQPQQGQVGASTAPNSLDAVTMATPMGGVQFINANKTTGFHRAVDIIRPCVVNINAVRPSPLAQPVANPNAPRFIDPFDGVPDNFINQMAFESVGSGVIVDPSGYVVTNHHVVDGANAIIVTRFRHQEGQYSARMVASDSAKDLALLQIIGNGPFPAATLADANRIEVGDWVLAVGNPFGLEHTVTAGIISGKRSSLVINGVKFKGLLQTDAPINKGSSGGPLVDMNGQVVGINTAIYAPTGVFNGTGFAIPSNRVGAFVARFTQNNMLNAAMQQPVKPKPVWLGIGAIDMTPSLAAKLSYPHAGGIYVSSLVLDSPADEAEITRGDIITAISGRPIQDIASLQQVLDGLSAGQVISVTIWRGGKTETTQLQTRVGRIIGG